MARVSRLGQLTCYGRSDARHVFYDTTRLVDMPQAVRGQCFTMPTCYGGSGARHVFYNMNGPLVTGKAVPGICFTTLTADLSAGGRCAARAFTCYRGGGARHVVHYIKRPTCYRAGGARHVFCNMNKQFAMGKAARSTCFSI